MDSYQKFEDAIVEYWEAQGHLERASALLVRCPASPLLEIPLLEKLLTVAVRDGAAPNPAVWLRLWTCGVAEELRAAGFDAQSVWPRLVRPRVLDPSVLRFIGSLDARTAENAVRSFLALPAPTPTCSGRPIASRSMWGYPLG